MKLCSVEGCERKLLAKGMCSSHYDRFRKYGTTEPKRMTERGAGRRFVEDNVGHASQECLFWPFPTCGYPEVSVDGKRIRAHRYMCILKHGEPNLPALEAAHSCGQGHKGCVNPNHIRWLTPSENQLERRKHGTSNAGDRNGRRKINSLIAEQIRNDARSPKEIAAEFGITRASVWVIKTGRAWAIPSQQSEHHP